MPRPQLPPRKPSVGPASKSGSSPQPKPALRQSITPRPVPKPQVFKSFQDLAQHVEVKEEKKQEAAKVSQQRYRERSRVEEVVKHNPHRVQAKITWQGLTYLCYIDDDGNKVVRDLSGGGKPWEIDMFISSKDSSAEFRRLLSQAILLLR